MKLRHLIVAVAAICTLFTLSASAATTSDIISKLKAEGVSSVQIAQAEDFFKSSASSFTSAQLDTVSASIEKIASIMQTNNVTDPADLPASAKAEVKNIVTETASATGVTASFGNSSGVATLTISANGKTFQFSDSDSTPKTTGQDGAMPFIFITGGIILAAGSAAYVVLRRKKVTA